MSLKDVLLPLDVSGSQTPSMIDGFTKDEEMSHRIFGCECVQQAGIALDLPQVVMVTGQNLLHRFFYRKSLKRFDAFTVAMACLCLASKIEEKPKYLHDFIMTFHKIYQERKGYVTTELDIQSDLYNDWKEELMTAERYILKDLGFCFYSISNHPHKFILYLIKLLDGSSELAQIAWNYLNDSCRLDLALRYESQILACAAIYMALRVTGTVIPTLTEDEQWWMIVTEDFSLIEIICEEILSLYDRPKVIWINAADTPPYLTRESNIKRRPAVQPDAVKSLSASNSRSSMQEGFQSDAAGNIDGSERKSWRAKVAETKISKDVDDMRESRRSRSRSKDRKYSGRNDETKSSRRRDDSRDQHRESHRDYRRSRSRSNSRKRGDRRGRRS